MFVPFTPNGGLIKALRAEEEKLDSMTGYRLKLVERAGSKLEDVLHKSDPWCGADCGRAGCLLCRTKTRSGVGKSSECSKRNIVYQTWCVTCLEKDEAELASTWTGAEFELREKKKC